MDPAFFITNPEFDGAEKALLEQHKIQREQQAAQQRQQMTAYVASLKKAQAAKAQADEAAAQAANGGNNKDGKPAEKLTDAQKEEKLKREKEMDAWRERERERERDREIARRTKLLEKEKKMAAANIGYNNTGPRRSSSIVTDKLRSKSGKISSSVQIHEDNIANTVHYSYQQYEQPRGELLRRCLLLGTQRNQGSRVWHRYWTGLRDFITIKLSKREFDELLLVKLALPSDLIELHNRFVIQILSNIRSAQTCSDYLRLVR